MTLLRYKIAWQLLVPVGNNGSGGHKGVFREHRLVKVPPFRRWGVFIGCEKWGILGLIGLCVI